MDIRAAEISSIIKEQIAGFGLEADVAEIGQVISVGDGVARVYGLDNVQAGELAAFPTRRPRLPATVDSSKRCPTSRWSDLCTGGSAIAARTANG